jgi:hypothetical protein
MNEAGPTPEECLATLLTRVGARAAGWWRLVGDRLEQVAFLAVEDMPAVVAREFAAATRSVPMDQTGLGILAAARTGKVTVSRVDELPAEFGSGLWLRKFGAMRSIALPSRGPSGDVIRVISVALSEPSPDDTTIARLISVETSNWSDGPPPG